MLEQGEVLRVLSAARSPRRRLGLDHTLLILEGRHLDGGSVGVRPVDGDRAVSLEVQLEGASGHRPCLRRVGTVREDPGEEQVEVPVGLVRLERLEDGGGHVEGVDDVASVPADATVGAVELGGELLARHLVDTIEVPGVAFRVELLPLDPHMLVGEGLRDVLEQDPAALAGPRDGERVAEAADLRLVEDLGVFREHSVHITHGEVGAVLCRYRATCKIYDPAVRLETALLLRSRRRFVLIQDVVAGRIKRAPVHRGLDLVRLEGDPLPDCLALKRHRVHGGFVAYGLDAVVALCFPLGHLSVDLFIRHRAEPLAQLVCLERPEFERVLD